MAFYSDFAGHYEKVFPFRDGVFHFLDGRLPPKGRVLDIGCGTGGYCGRLISNGRTCLGIDLDPGMIEVAQAANPGSEYRILDMAAIGVLAPTSFTGIFCLGNVLPHLPSADLAGFLAAVWKLLVPGGIWIFQTVNFDPLLVTHRYDFPVLEIPEASLQFHRSYQDITSKSLLFSTHLVQGGQRLFSGETTLYPHTAREFLAANREADFTLLDHFADYMETPYDPLVRSGNVMVFRKG
ncbi:MAG: methyltransferase domain-containing protein [Gemmatimonadales bacterium]|nr:methyltransferase domain-containing protein [Gemmatimonadales bacterium]